MGQYWQVVSPEQKEQLSTLLWGKLGEILPAGCAGRHLQQRLMMPQDRQRGLLCGQSRFIVKDIAIEQKLKAFLSEIRANIPTERDEYATTTEENLTTILNEIYNRARPQKTGISLGDYFNEESIPGLMRLLFDHLLGTWADQKIVCVGDYSNKLPPGYQASLDTLYNEQYKETLSLTDLAGVLLENFESHCPSKAPFFQEEYSRLFEEFFPSNQQHILLNLTSQEYVVSKVLWGKELKKHYDAVIPGLGDAAMTGICWSQDPSTSMESDCIDIEGKWAGHRFIIVSQSVFDETTGREGWKDASENVYGVLNNIWKVENVSVVSAMNI
ncbi:hypothetical protein OIDMADRAFT_61898 [Oidiodendron maius Zn]|uniref:Uncharacterized protein n=1 Tax=Oidiodendron maius (strain Zn) TaxID=913774 RepID=A0A0C3GRP7_OIDMZ|nr:hypothetical protein OIDMADRAFT_61898 [Oidiodendron maius Zn]